jgi:hypothetical protein
MSETSRYLALERRIRRSAGRGGPGWLLSADADLDDWTGTADRLLPPEDGSTPLVAATSLATVARAFDDGAPIKLHYDDNHFCPRPQADAPTAAPAVAAAPAGGAAPAPTAAPAPVQVPAPGAPAAPGEPAAVAQPAPQPTPQPDPAPAPAPASRQASAGRPAVGGAPPAAPTAADLAAIDDDADFAKRLREMVDQVSGPPSTTPTPSQGASPEAASAGTPAPTAETAPADENRYGVFDRIGEALASPRTFDLGSVPVTAAFDAIEQAMDRKQRAGPPRSAPAPPPALDDVDLVEDLALMPTALAAPAPAWIGYTPAGPGILMIGQREVTTPTGLSVRNWAAPGVAQFASKSTRALSAVRQIVIHETATHSWEGLRAGLGVQLHLERDGTLVQHNDVLDMLWHVKTFSPHSVGIEVVSRVFDADALADPGELETGDRIPIAWGGQHGAYYIVPPAMQMEALAQAVDVLRLHLAVPDNWLQVMEHPDPARAAGDMQGHTFFLLSTAGHQYFTTVKDDPWIASHSVLRDHEDGAFPTLYCWLRLHKAMAPADAYQLARQIVEDPGGHRRQTHHDKTTDAKLQLLDITDVA